MICKGGFVVIMNKTVLITGASHGIGKACAIAFSAAGYNVVLNYNSSQKQALDLCEQLENTIAIKADVSKSADVDEMLKKTSAMFGGIDVLINNAGIANQKLFTDITEQEWDNMFNVNVKSMFLVTKAFLPQMINRKCGKIINISSMWGISGASCEVHYSASKAAVIGFTKALAKEVAPSNINVNCIAPGVIMTQMNRNLSDSDMNILKEETPINRIGTPEDIANTALFLADEKSSFITGQIISVDGGFIL